MTRPPVAWLSRELQRNVLLQLASADAAGLAVDELRLDVPAGADVDRNLLYLQESGLVECAMGAAGAVARVQLLQLGACFAAAADFAAKAVDMNFNNGRPVAAGSQ